MRCPLSASSLRIAVLSIGRRLSGTARAAAIVAWCAAVFAPLIPVVHAQNPANGELDLFKPVADGPGIQGRIGHIGFPTFGRNTSISHAELFPYVLEDNQMFFADWRMFMTNYGQLGGNVGLGYRTRPWGGSNIFGASLWYDADDSLDELYQDVGLSLEHYSDLFDARINGYVPVGEDSNRLADRLTNPRFVGNNLLYDRVLIFGTALAGVDYEVGMPLPATFMRQHNMRAYLGAYHFSGNGVDMISGGKARLEGSIIPSVEAQVAVTSDSYFGTNATIGVSWSYFGKFERTETNRAMRYDRMGEFVNRNYNVIVAKRKDVTTGVQAINPATGLPFVIQHVGPNGNSTGAVDDPWDTIAEAQTAGGDVIIVHAGTVITENIILGDGDIIIGQGDGFQDYLSVQGYGSVAIPQVLTGAAPVIEGVTGHAVTMADDSVFAGFRINSPTGHGIFSDGVEHSVLSNLEINGAGGDGLFVNNATGSHYYNNVDINDAVGAGFHVAGGSANVFLTGKIETDAGRSIVIENTTDGLVSLAGATVVDDGGDGVQVLNNDGDVILDNLTVEDSSGVGVEIRGGEGAVTLLNKTKVTNAGGAGLVVADRKGNTLVNETDITAGDGEHGIEITDNDGDTWFNLLKVTGDDATAFHARNSDRVTVLAGEINSVGGPAFDAEDTKLNMLFNKVSSNGGPFGIRIVGGEGVFAISGVSAFGSGGVIQNADVGVILQDFETFGVAGLDLKQNGVGLQADNVEGVALTSVRVLESDSHALELLNVDEFHSVNSQFIDNGSLDATIVYEVTETGSRVFDMASNTIETDFGDAIRLEGLAGAAGSSLNFSFHGNSITTQADFSSGVNLDWNGVLLANALNNGFSVNGDDSVGYNISTSGAGLAQISLGNNMMLMEGDENVAIQIHTLGPSEVIIGGNQIAFGGTGSTGLDLSLAESADVAILSNTIIDTGGGGTGMYFRSLNGPSVINVESNTLDFRGPGALIDRGIIFGSITDTVTLDGNRNNAIFNATTPFFVPAGTTTGKLNINGVMLPQ